jgi:hypothetical protein
VVVAEAIAAEAEAVVVEAIAAEAEAVVDRTLPAVVVAGTAEAAAIDNDV